MCDFHRCNLMEHLNAAGFSGSLLYEAIADWTDKFAFYDYEFSTQ